MTKLERSQRKQELLLRKLKRQHRETNETIKAVIDLVCGDIRLRIKTEVVEDADAENVCTEDDLFHGI